MTHFISKQERLDRSKKRTHDEGFEANRRYAPRCDCPYRDDCGGWQSAWLAGWDVAEDRYGDSSAQQSD